MVMDAALLERCSTLSAPRVTVRDGRRYTHEAWDEDPDNAWTSTP
jgi:hypothetical protein